MCAYSWVKTDEGAFDLTRSARMETTAPKTLPTTGSRGPIIVEPSRTALVIIDMQSILPQPLLQIPILAVPKAVNPTP